MVVVGDCNFYSPSEPGYAALTSTATGTLVDPLGSWVRNDKSASNIYTQSTRTAADGGCGGRVGGGMDDRFDLILFSKNLYQRYTSGSYKAFGNDGVDRLNSSIDDPANIAVSTELAEAPRIGSLASVCRSHF